MFFFQTRYYVYFPVKIVYNAFKELIILNRIKQLRNEKNINQDVLAKLLGLEIAGISKLETGRVPLKDEYIVKLAEYFNVSTDYLLGKTNIRNPEKQINIDDADIAFASGIKGLNETNKMIIKNTIEALLAKQEKDDEDKKE